MMPHGEDDGKLSEIAPFYGELEVMVGRSSNFAKNYLDSLLAHMQKLKSLGEISEEEYKTNMHALRQKYLQGVITGDEYERLGSEIQMQKDMKGSLLFAEDRLNALLAESTIYCSENDIDIERVVRMIRGPTLMSSEEAESNAPNVGAQDYLYNKYFINQRDLYQMTEEDGGKFNIIVQAADREAGISVPPKLFISAAGFNSWCGRGSSSGLKDGSGSKSIGCGNTSSIDVIKYYASFITEAPPIDIAHVHIQPNGLSFISSYGDGSHRIGAAILKRQEAIQCEKLHLTLLTRNIF